MATKRIDCTPVGLQTEEGVRRVNKAMERQENAVKRITDVFPDTVAALETLSVLIQQNCYSVYRVRDAEIEIRKDLQEAQAALRAWRAANDELIRAVANRPPIRE